jgi:hypothetical protein
MAVASAVASAPEVELKVTEKFSELVVEPVTSKAFLIADNPRLPLNVMSAGFEKAKL